jgi:hypothetical protein
VLVFAYHVNKHQALTTLSRECIPTFFPPHLSIHHLNTQKRIAWRRFILLTTLALSIEQPFDGISIRPGTSPIF